MTPKPRRQQRHIDPDSSGVLRLRSDPSVASLLDLYDSHGCLSDEAFSNASPSPPSTPVHRQEDEPRGTQTKEGRAQVRRNGSTLRQLLGSPAASSGDGDISWAERFLGCVQLSFLRTRALTPLKRGFNPLRLFIKFVACPPDAPNLGI